jgi:hypothetical protein
MYMYTGIEPPLYMYTGIEPPLYMYTGIEPPLYMYTGIEPPHTHIFKVFALFYDKLKCQVVCVHIII